MRHLPAIFLGSIAGLALALAFAQRPSTFSWQIPTTNTDGSPLPVSDINQFEVDCGMAPFPDFGSNPQTWGFVARTDGNVSTVQATVPAGYRYCAVYTQHRNGNWSDPSNIVDISGLPNPNPDPDPTVPKVPMPPGNFRVE